MTIKPLTAAEYHRATSYHRHRLTPHTLDWAHQPVATKRYLDLPRVPLDRNLSLPEIDYADLVRRVQPADSHSPGQAAVDTIAAICHLTMAITAKSSHSGQPFYYRSVASAGALYPFELYLSANRIGGLDPGVYHYDLLDFSLTALRRGPVAAIPSVAGDVAATFYISGIFFRSAWKYRSRAYRYVLLDAGHLLENLRLALRALNLHFSIHLDFDDERAATLLGLDPEREVCLACVHLHTVMGRDKQVVDEDRLPPLVDGICRASRVSDREIAYADILAVHRAGCKCENGSDDVRPALELTTGHPPTWIDLETPVHPVPVDYARMLWQRRSRRNFIPAAVSSDSFMGFMDMMAAGMGRASGMPRMCASALTVGILVGENFPVAPGFYLLDPVHKRMGRVVGGRLIAAMAAACLDQMWLKHAGVHLLLMSDPAALDRTWGTRGYRYAMIEAGRLGQQAYLAAEVAGWGACGIGAIYDREATDLLGLSVDVALLYLVGTGPFKAR